MVNNILLIAAGGAGGALLRYYVSIGAYHVLGRGFPVGTLIVNITGSILIGFVYIYIERLHLSNEWRLGLIVGLLGAFTTFSTFSWETLNLLQEGYPGKAVMNIVLSVVLCLAGCWLGIRIAQEI